MNVEKLILIVDDDERNRKLLTALVRGEGYRAESVCSGKEAVARIAKEPPDLILLDIMMPGMDGLEVTRHLKGDPFTATIPIILVKSLTDKTTRLKGLEAGAEEFLTKPVERADLRARLRNLLRLKEYADLVTNHNHILQTVVQDRTQELIDTQLEIVRSLGRAAEYRDNETGLHTVRMSNYSRLLAEAAGMDENWCDRLMNAAPMHDIGKVGIPDSILLKPNKLNVEEFSVMQEHCKIGAKILSGKKSELLDMAHTIAIAHHERWDGRGYPFCLAGTDIPFEARLVAVADVFDALSSSRPYKQAWTFDKAAEEIITNSGKHFDPEVVNLFESNIDRIRTIQGQFSDT